MKLREIIECYVPCCEQEENDRRMMLRYMDIFDDTLLRTNETAHFTASAWVVNKERNKLLMVYHNIYNSWSWTGGHADGEEDMLSIALREVQEETGLESVQAVSDDVFSLEILTVNAHFKKGRYVVPHLHLNLTYLIEADEAQMLKIKPDENSGVKWFGPDEAVEASVEPDMRVIYRKLNNKLFALRK